MTDPQSESANLHETAGRVVQPTEIHDLLADVEGIIMSLDEPFVRVEIKPVSAEQWKADQKLAKAVSEADECLNCGKALEKGGFCGIDCLQEWGGSSE